jgi:hypothetical protein
MGYYFFHFIGNQFLVKFLRYGDELGLINKATLVMVKALKDFLQSLLTFVDH